MATNAVTSEDTVVDDDKEVTEQDLHDLKYDEAGVEIEQSTDEPAETDEAVENLEDTDEEDSQTDDQVTGDEAKAEVPFVKQVPSIPGETPEEYYANLEKSYQASTGEALRLKRENDALKVPKPDGEDTTKDTQVTITNPLELYAKQKMDEEISQAFGEFSTKYTQVTEPVEYDRFTREVQVLSQTIQQSQGRLASPKELYDKAAVILGWTPTTQVTEKDRLDEAVKNGAASSKTSNTTKPVVKSKVTEAMILANRKMYPGKSDKEIREELEPYL